MKRCLRFNSLFFFLQSKDIFMAQMIEELRGGIKTSHLEVNIDCGSDWFDVNTKIFKVRFGFFVFAFSFDEFCVCSWKISLSIFLCFWTDYNRIKLKIYAKLTFFNTAFMIQNNTPSICFLFFILIFNLQLELSL